MSTEPSAAVQHTNATNAAATKRGRKSDWSDEQKSLIELHIPAWEAQVKLFDPNITHRTKELTDWKNKTALNLLALPQFQDLPQKYINAPHLAKESIKRRFTNYRNSTMSTALGKTRGSLPPESLHASAKALMDLKVAKEARTYFKEKNEALIHAEAERNVKCGMNWIAAYARAWKDLWDKADQAAWQLEASSHSHHTQNQKRFPRAMFDTLRGFCSSGTLGPLAIATAYAFRRENNTVECGIVEATCGSDSDGLLQSLPSEVEDFQHAFEEWATATLPLNNIVSKEGDSTANDNSPPSPSANDQDVVTDSSAVHGENAGERESQSDGADRVASGGPEGNEDNDSPHFNFGPEVTPTPRSPSPFLPPPIPLVPHPATAGAVTPPATASAEHHCIPSPGHASKEGRELTPLESEDSLPCRSRGNSVEGLRGSRSTSPPLTPPPPVLEPETAMEIPRPEEIPWPEVIRGGRGRQRGGRRRAGSHPKQAEATTSFRSSRRQPKSVATQHVIGYTPAQLDWHEVDTKSGEKIVIKRVKTFGGYYRRFADGTQDWFDDTADLA